MGRSLRRTLVISHGTLLAAVAAAAAVAYLGPAGPPRAARAPETGEAVRARAARDAEACAVEIGLATLDHLDDHDPTHLDRVRRAEAEFDRAIRACLGAAADRQTQAWAKRVEIDFGAYAAAARGLLADAARLPQDVQEFARARAAHHARINAVRDDAAAGGRPGDWAEQLDRLGERVQTLAQLILDSQQRPAAVAEGGLGSAATDCLRAAAALRPTTVTADDRAALGDLEEATLHLVRLATRIDEAVRTKRQRVAELARLRRQLGDLLAGARQPAAAPVASHEPSEGHPWTFAVLGCAVAAAGAWVCFCAARSITRQVRALAEATRARHGGAVSVPSGPIRELNELAGSFNRLIADRHATRSSLRAANDTLDERARERTTERSGAGEAAAVEPAGAAHDLNNLLTVVNGCCFRLEQRVERDPAARDLVRTIQEVAAQAAGITRSLRALGRPGDGRPQTVSLNEVVERARVGYCRTLGEGVECAVDLAADAGRVAIDEGQVELVVRILVENASDAMPAGGRIRIASRSHRDPAGAAWVALAVAGTGPAGPEPAAAPSHAIKMAATVAGMRRDAVKGVVERAGGRIEVDSRPGSGTLVSLYLPAAADRPPAASAPALPVAGGAAPGPEMVLVVENDARVRAITVAILKGAGYDVVEAGDAVAGMREATARAGRLAVLVTDVVMPGPSGWVLAAEVAGLLPAVRIVVVTGHGERDMVPEPVAGFVHTSLPKPYTAKDLLRAVGGGRGQVASGDRGTAGVGGAGASLAAKV